MDPFTEVQQDAQSQLQTLQTHLSKLQTTNATPSSKITQDAKADFINNLTELRETINDLEDSVKQVELNPSFFGVSQSDIKARYDTVSALRTSYENLQRQWETIISSSSSNINTNTNTNTTRPFQRYEGGDTEDRGAQIASDESKLAHQYQQSQILQEQDTHLDSVYNSMQTINQQAHAMGQELEEQAYIIDELDGDLERVGGKVGGALKKIEYVLRKNEERGKDCCIGVLIVVLIVLLVMIIIA